MDSSSLIENYETGLFESMDGSRFLRCEFNPEEPLWINVSGNLWSVKYAGLTHSLNWEKLGLAESLTVALREVMLGRLRKKSPYYLPKTELMLTHLVKSCSVNHVSLDAGFVGIKSSKWLAIWNHMQSSSRSIFRSIYQELAEKMLAGADFMIAKEMRSWKARSDTQTLRKVLEWDANQGSFSSAEWELIREALNNDISNESDADCATRIFGRVLNETLKRPQQILSIMKDAFWSTPSGREHFLRIPKAKGQAGELAASWQITESLAKAIREYSLRPQISELQKHFDRLIVFPAINEDKLDTISWMNHGQVDVLTAKQRLQNWALKLGIVSHRTGKKINLTPYRIRHTGATAMALQGISRDQIQEVLEHDSPYSADAYIQSVGSDLIPALERATDRGVGKIFSELRNAYFFKGTVVENIGPKPVYIPIIQENLAQPAVVGNCGKEGACTKHPFWQCYNGCPHFLAWRDAPHHKSLEFVESELRRWGDAEGGKERSKLGKDFDRVGAAIHQVIEQIDKLNHGES